MNVRSGYRLPRGQWVVFGLLLTLSIGMMGASGTRFARTVRDDVNFMLNPVEGWINDTADTVGSYWFTLTQLDHVRSENEQLREENQTLKEELARMPGIARLNDDWTKISQAQQTSPYQPIIARVVVRDISDVRQRTIVINRGLADGITLGQVIIDAGGALVGRVKSVETYDATVLLVNDSSAVVIGHVEEAGPGAAGTIHGQIGGLLLMSYVNATDKLANGQAVVTAGMVMPGGDVRSPYPPGLLIGTIIKVSKDPNQVVQSAVVQPAADLNGIEWVLVITNYQGGFATPGPSVSPSSGPSPSTSVKPTPVPPPATPSPTPTASPTPGIVTPPPH